MCGNRINFYCLYIGVLLKSVLAVFCSFYFNLKIICSKPVEVL